MREHDAPFTLHVEGQEGVVRIAAEGELDGNTAPSVAAALRPHRGSDVVVDLSAVSFADSAFVRALVEERHHAHLEGATFVIEGATERVRRSFDVCGAAGLFDWRA